MSFYPFFIFTLSFRHTVLSRSSSLPCSRRAGAQMRGRERGEVLTTSCVYVCMVWPHRQLPALAGGEQATSRQNELPSPTQLSERSRELRPHRPRYLRRSARSPKLQQCTLDARRFVSDQGEGVGRTTLRTWEVEETAFRQCQAPSTLEIPPAVHHSLT